MGMSNYTILRPKFNANLSFVSNISYDFYYLVLKYRSIKKPLYLGVLLTPLTPAHQHLEIGELP